MALITIELPNESFDVEIEGDQPNEDEQAAIESLIKQKTLEADTSSTEETVEEAPKFDTGTGISSGSLRAALSMAENNEEEDLILAKFGIEEGEYLRDNRGRLALTPEGASKVGQEITQNTLIDEEGFSKYDFADLASIAPELVGGVTGAIKGAAAGTAIAPGFGTIIGGAIGAGLGSGAGQGVEEIIEGLAGVSKQSAASIAGDMGKEAAIGFLGDLTFGVAGALFKSGKSMTYGLKELPKQEAKVTCEAMSAKVPVRDPAGQPLKELDELGNPVQGVLKDPDGNVIKNPDGSDKIGDILLRDVNNKPIIGRYEDAGLTPGIGSMGASGLASRKERIGQKVLGSTQKQEDNYNNMLKHINYFKSLTGDAGETSAEEVGEILSKGVQTDNAILEVATKDAQDSVLSTLEDMVAKFGTASEDLTKELDDEIFAILKDSSKAFNTLSSKTYSQIDDALTDTIGTSNFLDTSSLKLMVKNFDDKTSAASIIDRSFGGAEKSQGGTISALKAGVDSLGQKTSFAQLYNIRSSIKRLETSVSTENGAKALEVVGKFIDKKLTAKNFKAELAGNAEVSRLLTPQSRTILDDAANSLSKARGFYEKGTTAFEQLGDHIGVRSLTKLIAEGKEVNLKFAEKLIKNGNPKPLKTALETIKKSVQQVDQFGKPIAGDTSKGAIAGIERAELLRGRLANSWIKGALKNATGKVRGDLADDLAFSGVKFSQSIDDLGSTAKVLFGDQADQVVALGKQIRLTSSSNITPDAIQRAVAEGAPGDLIGSLKLLKEQQFIQNRFQNDIALKALNNQSITPLIASETLAKPNARAESVASVMDFFRDRANKAIGKDPSILTKAQDDLSKIQNFYMNNVLKDFGGDAFIDGASMKAFSKSFNEGGANGKFRSVFGESSGMMLEKFGRALNVLSKQAQGGDLIAANIASAPFQNVGKIFQIGIVTRFLLNKPVANKFMKNYEKAAIGQGQVSRSKLFLEMFTEAMAQFSAQAPGQLMQEAVNEGTKQLSAVAKNSGLTSELQNLRSNVERGVDQNRTNVRSNPLGMNVQPASNNTGIGAIDVTDPSTALALGLNPSMQAIASRNQQA